MPRLQWSEGSEKALTFSPKDSLGSPRHVGDDVSAFSLAFTRASMASRSHVLPRTLWTRKQRARHVAGCSRQRPLSGESRSAFQKLKAGTMRRHLRTAPRPVALSRQPNGAITAHSSAVHDFLERAAMPPFGPREKTTGRGPQASRAAVARGTSVPTTSRRCSLKGRLKRSNRILDASVQS